MTKEPRYKTQVKNHANVRRESNKIKLQLPLLCAQRNQLFHRWPRLERCLPLLASLLRIYKLIKWFATSSSQTWRETLTLLWQVYEKSEVIFRVVPESWGIFRIDYQGVICRIRSLPVKFIPRWLQCSGYVTWVNNYNLMTPDNDYFTNCFHQNNETTWNWRK